MKKLLSFICIGFVFLFICYKFLDLNQLERKKESIKEVKGDNMCVALNYHRVRKKNITTQLLEKLTRSSELTTYSVYDEDFEDQLDLLIKEGAYFATLDDLKKFRESGEYPEKCVWISFDDVDESVYNVAYPILKERNIPFTLFVIAGQVGSDDFNNLKMASWDELREMRDSGLASFGSHTYNMHYLEDDRAVFLHEDMYDDFKSDIKKSKEVIEEELGVVIDSIAYPFGESCEDINSISKEAGFKSAYILNANPIDKDTDLYYQSRYLISRISFESGITPWIKK